MLVRTIGAFIAMLCGYACYWSARWAIADWAIRSSVAPGARESGVLFASGAGQTGLGALCLAPGRGSQSAELVGLDRARRRRGRAPGLSRGRIFPAACRPVGQDLCAALVAGGVLFTKARPDTFLARCPRSFGHVLR